MTGDARAFATGAALASGFGVVVGGGQSIAAAAIVSSGYGAAVVIGEAMLHVVPASSRTTRASERADSVTAEAVGRTSEASGPAPTTYTYRKVA